MGPELTALALATLLQSIQFALYATSATRQVGTKVSLGPRDEPRPLRGTPGRLQRALSNHFEALILFTVAVVVVVLSNQQSAMTAACAWVYLIARILYVPAYAFGWVPWRSVIFAVGYLATMLMILSALF